MLAACATTPRPAAIVPIEVQILAINDFHGNLEAPAVPVEVTLADGTKTKAELGGAAHLAATLGRLRQSKQSVTVAAGDLIGASPLTSAWFLDEPTIQALGAAGLNVAAIGNHEFDKGSEELLRMQNGGCEKYTTRVPCRLEPHGPSRFQYLSANVLKDDGTTLLPATRTWQFAGDLKIAFIGMTLKETGILVTPAGVKGLRFVDEAATANALVPQLKAEGAEAIVLLIHQGGRVPNSYRAGDCNGLSGDILPLLDKLDPAIAIVVSGHTHNAYACQVERGGATRLLTSAGKNGYLVTDIRLHFDPSTQKLIGQRAENVPVTRDVADPMVASLVEKYRLASVPAAQRVVGRLSGPAMRSASDDESPAANLIADAQLAATRSSDRGDADISFINATGVRTDLVPNADGSVTFGQIFALQPFGNNLVVKTLTGEQLRALLEQQFTVENGQVTVDSLLVPSANFRFAYHLSKPEGQRIAGMWLDGKPIDPTGRYRVTVNNFLASGGDGFSVLNEGTEVFDAGLDLDALEAWLRGNPRVPEVGRVREGPSRE